MFASSDQLGRMPDICFCIMTISFACAGQRACYARFEAALVPISKDSMSQFENYSHLIGKKRTELSASDFDEGDV